MNKPVFYILLGPWLCYGFTPKAQENLVPNGSFEEFTQCPQGNDLNDGQFERAVGWWSPTMGTPDYFHRCNNDLSGIVGVPNNFWGHQEPYDGDGYIGIGLAFWNTQGIYTTFEYASTTLAEPLKNCFEYRFTMFVSMAEYSSYALNRIGILLSTHEIFNNDVTAIIENPQFFNQSEVLVDSVNWTRVEGTFIASGGERHLTIGYFFDSVENDTTYIQGDFFGSFGVYYFIDSVSLYQISDTPIEICDFAEIKIPNVFTPNGDFYNDLISIENHKARIKKMEILNRWGNVVAVLDEFNPLWGGGNCPDGVYFYIILFKDEKKKQTGFIHLIR